MSQLNLNCDGLMLRITPSVPLVPPIQWQMAPGNLPNLDLTGATWVNTIPDDQNYTFTITDANGLWIHTVIIPDLPTVVLTQADNTCSLIGSELCLDTEDYNFSLWTTPGNTTSSAQCVQVLFSGDYTVDYSAYIQGQFPNIPGSCTTFIDTGVELFTSISDPFNLNFNCANGGYTGSIAATTTGGSGFYLYNWNGATGQTLLFTTANPTETFTVTVTDLVSGITCTTSIQIDLSYFACTYDLNNDGVVSVADMVILVAAFGCTTSCDPLDLDCSGAIDITDIDNLEANYSTTCP